MNRKEKIVGGLLLGAVVSLLTAAPTSAIEVGQKAPNFTLTAPGSKEVKLADLLGKGPVVIYTFVDAFGAA
jgi:cytochrome oxidase Cu insertion factor (SCO1/SenC/PrrC family)